MQYRDVDRLLALAAAEREQRWVPDLHQQAELAERRQALQVDFAVSADPCPPDAATCTVTLTELRRFLYLPAQESLRRHLGVVLQDTFLFNTTIRENIRLGRIDASDRDPLALGEFVLPDEEGTQRDAT